MDMSYNVYQIPKKKGGFRTIESPNEELKSKQEEILLKLYQIFPVSPFAHGGIPNRNIVTNAINHVKKDIVASIDIKDFFPSIEHYRFRKEIQTLIQRSLEKQNLRDEITAYCFYKDHLPQGAPTSPYLANIYLSRFDWLMAWFIAKNLPNGDYSRYFDDITISCNFFQRNGKVTDEMKKYTFSYVATLLKKMITYELKEFYYLDVNEKKTKIISRKSRQYVCGIVVNDKVNVPRRYRKNLRAAIYQHGFTNENIGKLAYVNQTKMDIKLKTTREFLQQYVKKSMMKYALLQDNYKFKFYERKLDKINEVNL